MLIRPTILLSALLFAFQSASAFDWVKSPHDNNPASSKIESALEESTKIDFIEVPLRDVMDYLSDLHKIPIVIDRKSLDREAMGTDIPITRRLEGITLRSALRLLLNDLDLTFSIRDEVLMITSIAGVNQMTEIRVYNVTDLLEEDEPADHLAQTILTTLRAAAGNVKRGGGAAAKPIKSPLQITPYRSTLIVRDTYQGHAEVTRVLAALKQLIAPSVVEKPELPEVPDDPNPEPKEGAGPLRQ